MNSIVKILGQSADHLLNDGQRTEQHFTRTESNSWGLKLRLEWKNKAEAVEQRQCIDLLEAMLELEQNERITPSEVIIHPYIDKGHHSSNIKKNRNRIKMTMEMTHTKNGGLSPASTQLPTSPIMVRPKAAKGFPKMRHDLDISLKTDIDRKSRNAALASVSEELPATAALREDDTSGIHPDQHSAASPIGLPSGVIMVRLAAPENTLQLEDEESAVDFLWS